MSSKASSLLLDYVRERDDKNALKMGENSKRNLILKHQF